jgi:hypothetical protein
MKTETHVFEDPQLVAFLSLPSYHFKITPQKTPTGRVSFAVEGAAEEIEKALHDLTDNVPVGSRSLLESIKRVRTTMFTTKQGSR